MLRLFKTKNPPVFADSPLSKEEWQDLNQTMVRLHQIRMMRPSVKYPAGAEMFDGLEHQWLKITRGSLILEASVERWNPGEPYQAQDIYMWCHLVRSNDVTVAKIEKSETRPRESSQEKSKENFIDLGVIDDAYVREGGDTVKKEKAGKRHAWLWQISLGREPFWQELRELSASLAKEMDSADKLWQQEKLRVENQKLELARQRKVDLPLSDVVPTAIPDAPLVAQIASIKLALKEGRINEAEATAEVEKIAEEHQV